MPDLLQCRCDGSAGIAGYREDLAAPVDAATRAIVALWLEHGITSVRVSDSTWAELALLRGVLAEAGTPVEVLGGGPTLVGTVPTHERELWAHDAATVSAAAEAAAAFGAGWLNVATHDEALLRACLAAAARHGLRVALQGRGSLAAALRPGDVFRGAAAVLREPGDQPVQTLQRWRDDGTRGAAMLSRLAADGILLTSELITLRRTTFVKESLSAAFLEDLEPIIPHARYVREMSRPGGFLVGRQQLQRHTGQKIPTGRELDGALDGWLVLLEHLRRAEPVLVPASASPQLTVVPGYALGEELAVLAHAGVTTAASLADGPRILQP